MTEPTIYSPTATMLSCEVGPGCCPDIIVHATGCCMRGSSCTPKEPEMSEPLSHPIAAPTLPETCRSLSEAFRRPHGFTLQRLHRGNNCDNRDGVALLARSIKPPKHTHNSPYSCSRTYIAPNLLNQPLATAIALLKAAGGTTAIHRSACES